MTNVSFSDNPMSFYDEVPIFVQDTEDYEQNSACVIVDELDNNF